MKGWFCTNMNSDLEQSSQRMVTQLDIYKSKKEMLTKSSEADIRSAGSFCML
jgi:hypothetical protein